MPVWFTSAPAPRDSRRSRHRSSRPPRMRPAPAICRRSDAECRAPRSCSAAAMASASAAGSPGGTRSSASGPKISGMPPTLVAMIGRPAARRLEHDVGQRFRARRNHQHAAEREGRRAPAWRRRSGSRRRGWCAATAASNAVAVGAVADDGGGDTAPVARKPRDRLDQHVDALELAQLADEDEIGGVRRERDRQEFGIGDAVVHDPHQRIRARLADLGGEGVAAVVALEQEQVGAALQRRFRPSGRTARRACSSGSAGCRRAACRRARRRAARASRA